MVDVTVIPLWLDGSELSLSFFGIEVMAPMHKSFGMCPVELMPRKRLRRSEKKAPYTDQRYDYAQL